MFLNEFLTGQLKRMIFCGKLLAESAAPFFIQDKKTEKQKCIFDGNEWQKEAEYGL
jgi:hypothetical protein